MGTYSITDAVTGEAIKEKDRLALIFLSQEEGSTKRKGLMAYSNERYQMASLPIMGQWNGIGITPDDSNAFSVQMAIASIGHGHGDIKSLMDALHNDAKIVYEASGKGYFIEPEKTVNYSVMAISEKTLERLNSLEDGKSYFNGHTSAGECNKAEALLQKFLELIDKRFDGDGNELPEIFGRANQVAKAIYFQSHRDEVEGLPVPYAAKSFVEQVHNLFDFNLRKEMSHIGVGEFKSYKHLEEERTLPSYYEDMYESVHRAQKIADTIAYLDVPLRPSISCPSYSRGTAKIEMLSEVLKDQLKAYVDYCSENMDKAELVKIDRVLNPIKSDVAEVIKQRNGFEKEIGKFNRKYGE